MKPIIFTTEEVKAILSGEKTQFRKPVKGQPVNGVQRCFYSKTGWAKTREDSDLCTCKAVPVDHEIGDILYVRETWADVHTIDEIGYLPIYRADSIDGDGVKWRHSIYMPKKYARLFLRIIEVKAQRLQAITEEEAKNDGASKRTWYQPYGLGEEAQRTLGTMDDMRNASPLYKNAFASLWDSLYCKKGLGWIDDPWVWTYTFKVVSNPEGPQK